MGIDIDTVVMRRERVVYRDLEDEGVLLDLDTGAYYSVNSTGRFIWGLLEQAVTFGEVVEALRGVCDGPEPEIVRADVEDFVAALVRRDLLTLKAAS